MDRRIQRILGDAPHMEHAGSDVALTISSGCLRISTLEGSNVVACHDMPNISFASGGDPVSFPVCLMPYRQTNPKLSGTGNLVVNYSFSLSLFFSLFDEKRTLWISSPMLPRTISTAELATSSNAEVGWRRTSSPL